MNIMEELKHSRHCVGGSNYHLQLTPKYRRTIFENQEARNLIEALMRQKAYKLGVHIEAIEFGPDHIHMFLMGCRKYDVPTLVQYFKGFSSRYIRSKRPDLVRSYLWGDSLWSDGYFYESIGRVTSETVKFYIERQQGKHWVHEDYDSFGSNKMEYRQAQLESFTA